MINKGVIITQPLKKVSSEMVALFIFSRWSKISIDKILMICPDVSVTTNYNCYEK